MTEHLSDAALWRHVDGEDDSAERHETAQHLDACPACRRRLADVRGRSAVFSQLLHDTDPTVPAMTLRRPRRRVSRLSLAVAAAVVLVLAFGTVDPLRAWIVERSSRVWATFTGNDGSRAPAPSPFPALRADSSAPASASLTYRPTGPTFTVRITRYQRRGSVTVETADVEEVTAVVLGGTEREDVQVMPDGLRVHNATTSTARYRFTVPSRLREIFIDVAGDTVARLTPAETTSTWTVELMRR